MSKSQANRRKRRALAFEPIEGRLLLSGNSPVLNTDVYNHDSLFDYAQISSDSNSSSNSYAQYNLPVNGASVPGEVVVGVGGHGATFVTTGASGSVLSGPSLDWSDSASVNTFSVSDTGPTRAFDSTGIAINVSGVLSGNIILQPVGSRPALLSSADLKLLSEGLQSRFKDMNLDTNFLVEFRSSVAAETFSAGLDSNAHASNLNDLLAGRGNLLISVQPTIGGGVELAVSVASTDDSATPMAGTPAPNSERPAMPLESSQSAAADEGGMIAVSRVIAELRSERAAVQVARSSTAPPPVADLAAAGVSGELARAVAFERIEGASEEVSVTSPVALLLPESSPRPLVVGATKAAVSDAVSRPELEHDAAGQIRLAAFVRAGVAGLGGGSLRVPMESIAAEWADDGSPVSAEATSDEVRREIFAGWDNSHAAPSRLADLKHRALSWDTMGVVTALACGHVATRSRKRRVRDAALVRGNREV